MLLYYNILVYVYYVFLNYIRAIRMFPLILLKPQIFLNEIYGMNESCHWLVSHWLNHKCQKYSYTTLFIYLSNVLPTELVSESFILLTSVSNDFLSYVI